MSSQNTPGSGGVGRRIEEAIELIEMELRHAVAYVNDAVIPQVRRESISAMRVAADTLHNLADRFERGGGTGPAAGSPPPQGAGQSHPPQSHPPKEPER
jgi:hypothetical protein